PHEGGVASECQTPVSQPRDSHRQIQETLGVGLRGDRVEVSTWSRLPRLHHLDPFDMLLPAGGDPATEFGFELWSLESREGTTAGLRACRIPAQVTSSKDRREGARAEIRWRGRRSHDGTTAAVRWR